MTAQSSSVIMYRMASLPFNGWEENANPHHKTRTTVNRAWLAEGLLWNANRDD